MCTRLPFQLRLSRRTDGKNTVTVQFENGEPCNTPEEVYQKIEQITIEKTNNKGVKDELIVLNIKVPSITELTVVDLPGIITVKKTNEPDNIQEQTFQLAKKYASDPNTIILAVVDGPVRLRDSTAIQLVYSLNAQSRSIGVLTKVDLCKNSQHDIPQKLSGSDIPLKPHGYFAVVNRPPGMNYCC